MSNRLDPLTRFWRARWPAEAARPSRRLARALTAAAEGPLAVAGPLATLEVALIDSATAVNAPLPPAIELAGRGYARPPVGPLYHPNGSITQWRNSLAILWPQARDDWGIANYVALLQQGVDEVLATAPIAAPFAVLAEDQPVIPVGELLVSGVMPDTPRPYGVGRYGESLYGGWPAEGDVFYARVELLAYQWATQPDGCAPWTDIVVVSGGCRA